MGQIEGKAARAAGKNYEDPGWHQKAMSLGDRGGLEEGLILIFLLPRQDRVFLCTALLVLELTL